MAKHHVLGHHPTKADPHHVGAVPADFVHQRCTVVCIVGHCVGKIRFAALPETALVIHQYLKLRFKQPAPPSGIRPQIASGSVNQNNPIT